ERVPEAVAAEADGQEEPGDPRGPVEDPAAVRGERTQTGPGVAHLRALQGGNAADRLLHRGLEYAPVHLRLVGGRGPDVAGAHQHRALLAPAVKAAAAVGDEGERMANAVEGVGDEYVPAPRVHRQIETGHAADEGRPGPGRVDHERRGDGARP